jgi:carbon storage regulator CsrA
MPLLPRGSDLFAHVTNKCLGSDRQVLTIDSTVGISAESADWQRCEKQVMLVLSRKVGVEIVIANMLIVGVARVFRDRVSLTIQAPANVLADRRETCGSKAKSTRP